MKHFKTFLAAMLLLLVGSNYVGAVEPNWPDSAVVPEAGQNYYIYNKTRGRFICFQTTSVNSFTPTSSSIGLGPTKANTATKKGNQAVLFKLENGTTSGYYKIKVVDPFGGKTWYMSSSMSSVSTSAQSNIEIPEAGTASGKKYYYIYKKGDASTKRLYLGTSTTDAAAVSYGAKSNSGKEWYFIPEKCIKGCSVSSKKADGTISITAPTDKGKASVTFNVSGAGTVSNFTWTSSNSKLKIGIPTRTDNVVTVPVHYTAENKHGLPIETATITLTSKDDESSKTGTANANVNLQPTFSTVVSALDWNRVNEEIVERFYVGMDVAASERDRLANKLLVSNANTMAKRITTTKTVWTATIIGDNAAQFKFPNGTQSYSGNYVSDNFLSAFDVHYAPTVAGEHTATLRIVASYTAANGAQTDTHDIALSGRCEAGSIITFAADDSPSDEEIYSFGNIIGTNKVDVTANLLISQVTDLQKVWSDPDGVFEFDPSSVNLSKVSQTLTFSAHRETPVTANTNHEATLTVSGISTVNGEPVSATFTLRYTAVPLTQPTVTWNWSSIREGLTAYNPITTNNNEAEWTLTKTAGDKLTYDPASNKNEATAEYLHHEPGQSAAFYLQIPQTDTYAAFEGEYETAIDVSPVPEIYLDLYSQYTDPSVMTYEISEFMGEQIPSASFEETQNKLTINSGGWVDFFTDGHNVISFSYDDDPGNYGIPNWTVTEYYGNNTSKVIYQNVVLTSGQNVTWQFSPNAKKIRIAETQGFNSGIFTNVRISEYDVIAADAEIVALIDDNGTVSDRDVTLTFANKRQVTATLNETAAQYFTIVDATPAVAVPEIILTEEVFNNSSLVAFSTNGCWGDPCAEFDAGDNKLSISTWVEFMTAGQSKISFHYDDPVPLFGTPNPIWTVKEYVGEVWNVIDGYENVDLTSGTDVTWQFSPNATKIRIEESNGDGGDFTNVRIYGEASSGGGGEPGSSVVFDSEDGLGVGKVVEGKVITVALKDGVNLADAKEATAGNACQLVLEDDYTYDHEVLVLPIAIVSPCDITYKHSDYGTYVVTYQGEDPRTVGESFVQHIGEPTPSLYAVTLSAPTPASGYQFQGWKINGVTVSCKESFTTSITVTCEVEAAFVAVEAQNFKVGEVYFADMGAALTAAGTSAESKIVTQMQDVTLGDGTTPVNYTVPAGVTFLIPHKKDFFELQETPDLVNVNSDELELAQKLSAYRTLTLKAGVTITCNGNICIAGNMVTANGGRKSAYPTGEVGLINMVHGGHIELNNGAHLYCWGYIKGQDMDQGNNTVGTGTVTANAGSTIWEDFELGDWRGGTASFNIYYDNETKNTKLFPFQSYAIQNVEVPTTYNYGSTLRTYTCISTGYGNHGAVFSMIGPENTLFLLPDNQSVVRMWYDPTTDLSCYELSGTAKLDALHITVYVSMSSENFILPISNSMHIILKDCNMNLANPLMVQAGAIVEIKPSATVNLTSELYLYDVDQWGKYVHDYYFRSFNNITSHKDRGAENSKAGLDDAKLIVDGTFNIKDSIDDKNIHHVGKLYTTAGGANIMGNNGGVINFNTTMPDSTWLWAVEVASKDDNYVKWVRNRAYAANLCNEDGSYTKSSQTTYYNVHGRWFYEDKKDEQPDHTYDFYYLDNGNAGEEEFASAVYSHDKTGLEARMKWFNVVRAADNCTDIEEDLDKPFVSNWWIDTLVSPAVYYNYTMLDEWHQFMATEKEGVYSGSDNKLYQKEECLWFEEAAVDENCLYTFTDGKKALVNGDFIPLTSNGYDPAYHKTDDASKYYICFTGCNWHPATPYTGESKAYTINPEAGVTLHYIWFNNDWLNVLRDEPFFYTEDEITNVRTYYEYINGEWEIATPYVSVRDAAETRTFYMIKEAFNVAQIKKDATITLLRDLPNVQEVLSYTTQNTTCTLDLNGHLLAGAIANLITVNAPGATFTITDNTDLKIGKISNAANKAVNVTKGTLVVANGTIEATGANAIAGAAGTTITITGGYFAANTQCVTKTGSGTCSISAGHFTKEAGLATYAAAHKYPFETTDPKYKWEVSDAWTITFKKDETVLQTLHLKPGEMPVYTETQPTKDNQHFTGWSPAIAAATADATYTAQFEAIPAGSKCVTLNSNGGDQGLQYIYVASGSAIGTLPETTKEGNTFAGWFTDATGGTQVSASTTVSADITWYAHYSKNSYTLTWDANGGQLSGSYTSGTVQYGAAITAPTATFEGHTFIGWNVTPATTMPAANTTYTAQWSVAAKHFLQNLDGTYPATPEAIENVTGGAGEYVTPAVKTYDGFITPETQTVRIGETTEITYNYARRTYTITLDATTNGGTCATALVEVKHGATPTLPDATKAGLSFDGWFTKAVGGDHITDETVIQRNIGKLYAQFVDNNLTVSASMTVSDTREVSDLRITTTGSLTITGKVTAKNLILEATSDVSGQLDASLSNIAVTNAYFDWTPNGNAGTANRTWYAIAVPWEVDAEKGIFLKETGRHLIIGRDFDLIYYSGSERALVGNKPSCWKYVENDDDKTMHPGQLYMMYFDPGFVTIRFAKKSGSAVLYTTPINVSLFPESTGNNDKDADWNGIANPRTYYASLSAGTATYAQVLNNGSLDDYFANPGVPVYQTINLASSKFTVGKPLFVQATEATSVVVTKQTTAGIVNAAPRRRAAAAAAELPKGIDAVYRLAIAGADEPEADNLFVQVAEDEKADRYTIGQDLVKGGVASGRAQVWVNRYDAKLSVNTQSLSNDEAIYPLSIQIPSNGEYTLSIGVVENEEYALYLTRNGEAIWNLSNGAYAGSFEKGTDSSYGLRVSAKVPQIATGIDEAVVDAQGETRKVLINDQVFIIRGENVYSVDGQLVK